MHNKLYQKMNNGLKIDESRKKKNAPYTREIINYPENAAVIVCTGSGAWSRAKNLTWFSSTPKLVLPYQDNPAHYNWPVKNRHVMVFRFGQSESWPRLIELAKFLLEFGAIWILLVDPKRPMVKFERGGND